MVDKGLGFFISVCVVGWFCTQVFYLQFLGVFGVPFGLNDIDNYLLWLGFERDFVTAFMFPDTFLGIDPFHVIFLLLIKALVFLSGLSLVEVFTFYNPFLVWFLLPSSALFLFSSLDDIGLKYPMVFAYMFGTNTLFLSGFCGLYSFMLGLVFFNFSVGFLVYFLRVGCFMNWFLLSSVLAVLVYPLYIGAYGCLVFSWLLRDRRYFFVGILSVGVVIAGCYLYSEGFAFFRGNVSQRDPSLGWFSYYFVNPIALFFGVVGLLSARLSLSYFFRFYFWWFVVLMLLVSPVVQLFRTAIVVYPFICYLSVGRLSRLKLLSLQWLYVLWFLWSLSFFNGLMIEQLQAHDPSFDRALEASDYIALLRLWGFNPVLDQYL